MSRIAKAVVLSTAAAAAVAGASGAAFADAGAEAAAVGSPGVLSGNVVQIPIHLPVNVCGNTINVIGLLNPAFGNTCVNA
ncbi:chaplin [Streptomyces sp. NPDC056835]|uniref:chaplin n=1 Tax=Streptomyces sp. NPDC056835 TaxID=3345956 RepID=UPI0036BE723C